MAGRVAPGAPGAGDSRSVLVVEDDADIAGLIRARLARAGWDALVAADIDQALDAALTRRLAAATVDLLLGATDGWQVARAVRATPGHDHLAIVVLSVLDRPVPPPDLPVAAVLSKPVRRGVLERALAAAVR